MVPRLKFSCLWMKLCMLTNSKMLISNTTLVFEILAENTIKAVLFQNLRIFIFGWNFVFRKIWGCWCKIPQHSSFFEFQPKNTLIRRNFCPTFKKVFLQEILHLDKLKVLESSKTSLKWSSFYLYEALYKLKFTSWKTKLLPNISKLCCYNGIFRSLHLNWKTISSKKFLFLVFTTCFLKDFCI